MNWRVVHFDDVLPGRWRNGSGETRELACWPDGGDWIWRMSVAEVAHSGPFSQFEGVQRWFAVLGGAGVRLSVGDDTRELTGSSAPFCFDGARPAGCELLAGSTRDFNLMVRMGQAHAQMTRVCGDVAMVLDAPRTVAVYATNSGASVRFENEDLSLPAQSLAWQALPAGATVQLSSAGALWMEIGIC